MWPGYNRGCDEAVAMYNSHFHLPLPLLVHWPISQIVRGHLHHYSRVYDPVTHYTCSHSYIHARVYCTHTHTHTHTQTHTHTHTHTQGKILVGTQNSELLEITEKNGDTQVSVLFVQSQQALASNTKPFSPSHLLPPTFSLPPSAWP